MADGRSGPGIGTVILVSALTAAAVSFGIVYATAQGWIVLAPAEPTDQEVPELRGLSVDAARGALDARGLRMVHRGDRHDPHVSEGSVLSQQPRAGSRVPPSSEVTVVVSLGPDEVDVPDLTGVPVIEARARLAAAGLRVATATREGGTGEPGTVSSTIPAAGQKVERGGEVTLIVVPAARMIRVPDFVGMGSRAAREAVVQAGLTLGRQRTRFDGDRSAFIVLQQTPAAGTEVAPGSAVELVINEE